MRILSIAALSLAAVEARDVHGATKLSMGADDTLVFSPEKEGGHAKLNQDGDLVQNQDVPTVRGGFNGGGVPSVEELNNMMAPPESIPADVTRDGGMLGLEDLIMDPLGAEDPTKGLDLDFGDLAMGAPAEIEGAAQVDEDDNDDGDYDHYGEGKLPFFCQMSVDFFPTHGPTETPKNKDVKGLLKATDNWLTDLFEIDSSFKNYKIDQAHDQIYTLWEVDEPDFFRVDFRSYARVDSFSDMKMTIDDIAMLVNHANYTSFIIDYIWPSGQVFYHTHNVTLGCDKGLRAEEARRQLRGTSESFVETLKFGGASAVEREY